MATSSVMTLDEPDQMEAAHAAARAEVMPTSRERLIWRVTRVELDNVWAIRVQETGPRIRHVELDPRRTFLSFLVRPGPDVFVRGVRRLPCSVVRHARGQAFYDRSSGPTEWMTLSMPTSEFMVTGSALAGREMSPPREQQLVITAPATMAHLLHVQAAVSNLA
jgi:hypothetical protein